MGDRFKKQKRFAAEKRNRVSVRHTTVNCDTKQETRFLSSGLWVLVAAKKETGTQVVDIIVNCDI